MNDFAKISLSRQNFQCKIVVKPNFISNEMNIKIKEKNDFIYASRLSEEKGIIDLINAHKKFNFNLNICGDGPLKNLVNEQKKINYLGFLSDDDVNKELTKSKFLILPSKWYEGFPTIILKALFMRLLF